MEIKRYYALQLMRPMRKGTNTEVDNMVFRIMRPNLWRCLKARNAKVRLNAIILLAMFYPILTDDFENEEYLERQREAFRELLFDDSYAVRIVACKSALSILASFWITFDNGYIEELLTKVVDNLSKDSIVPVRVAVFESLQFLLSCPQAVNALQRALKCLVPRGINDNNERVRLAAFELLTMLGKHRFIRFWNVVNMKLILQCFEVEESESVRKQITRLLFPSFMSMAVDADETIRRIIFMGAITRNGALSFHHLIVTMKLITVEQALEHVQMLAIVLCKLLRPLSSPNASSRSTGDSKIPMPSSASATPVIVDADEKDESEGAQQWRSCTLLLECLVVMWMALRKRIQGDSLKIERTRTTNILSKLFRMLFIGFKNSSIIESIMALGSTLSEQADVSVVVLRELLSGEPIDESRLSCYLEVASSWRFSCVLDYVHSGLHAVASLTNGSRISIKRAKRRNCSQKCSLSRALRYLEVVLKSPTMQQNLIANHYTQMEMFHTALLPLNNIIEIKVDDASGNVFKDRCQQISDGVILRAYEIRHTLSIIILNTLEDEEKRRQMEELLEEDAAWIVNTLMVKLVSHEEPDEALFLVHFCQDALRLFSYHLGTYPHSTRFKRIVADSIVVLTSKKTPAVFIISVLKTLKNLCRAAGGLDDEELVLETIVPLTRSCLLWMSERIDDDDFDVKARYSVLKFVLTHFFISGHFNDCDPLSVVAWFDQRPQYRMPSSFVLALILCALSNPMSGKVITRSISAEVSGKVITRIFKGLQFGDGNV
uniref:Condensin complex subunit 1 n=1 Tax=Parascaris univalens TaxID=6257 RepID=A0A915B1X8_PARUN